MHGSKFALVLLCVCVATVLGASVARNVSSQELPSHISPETLERLPGTSEDDRSNQAQNEMAATGPNWTVSVFQSLRDRSDWEIYMGQGWGTNPVQLTSNDAQDISPSLNRGNTRIVFVSDRDGNYEIYTMNLGGRSVKRLTYVSENDYAPVWSPDGTKIAFYSYRNNSVDIYVMNSDGSAQTRLTFTGLNRDPGWSPDGTKLVFVSYRNYQYGIWVMNADGSNAHQIGGSEPYMQHPSWSPDGEWIVYDADVDHDGFNEICVMNKDGNFRQVAVDLSLYGTQNETWANGWVFGNPDGQTADLSIAYTLLYLVQYQGNWYWREAYIEVQPFGYLGSSSRLTSSGLDWSLFNQTTDIVPPMARLESLPPYSRYADVVVPWEQKDDLSGVARQWLQVRENGGAWTDWTLGTDLDMLPLVYSGTSGSEVAFRLRIADHAYNWNRWTPDEYTPHTTLYAYEMQGTVRDSRDFPVPHGTLAVSRPVVGPVIMAPDGRFALRLEQGGGTQINVGAAGYGVSPAWHGSVAADTWTQFMLPPLDNVIQNGNFEAENFAGWALSGNISPVLSTDPQRPGSTTALLQVQQRLDLGETVPISVSAPLGEIIDSGLDSSGNLHLLALRNGSLNYLAQNTPDTWKPLEIIVSEHVMDAEFAVAENGTVHVIWWQDDVCGLFYCERGLEGTWSEPLMVVSPVTSPDIAVDGSGNVCVLYIDPIMWPEESMLFGMSRCRTPEGVWGNSRVVTYLPEGSQSFAFFDYADRLWVLFSHQGQNSTVCFADHPDDSFECYAVPIAARHLVVDRTNTLHLIDEYGFYAEIDDTGMLVSNVPLLYAGNGMLAVDSARNLYLVSASYGYVRLRYRPVGRDWTDPVALAKWSGIGAPQIFVDAEDNLLLVFEPSSGIPATMRSFSPQVKASALSQVIAIPAGLHKPTLSFDYTLRGAVYPTDKLFVTVAGKGLEVPFSTSADKDDWTRTWIDVSPWAGESVTLTFVTSVQNIGADLQASLDDVSLGSWLTPVPTVVTPMRLTPYTSTVITIAGSNFIDGAQVYVDDLLLNSTWISDTEITATLPATLAMGGHPLRVVNPGGQMGYAPQALQVGTVFYMPLVSKGLPWIQ